MKTHYSIWSISTIGMVGVLALVDFARTPMALASDPFGASIEPMMVAVSSTAAFTPCTVLGTDGPHAELEQPFAKPLAPTERTSWAPPERPR